MNGIDLLFALAGFAIVGIIWRQLECEKRHRELTKRHEANRTNWQLIDRLEAYGYRRNCAPDHVPAEWENAA